MSEARSKAIELLLSCIDALGMNRNKFSRACDMNSTVVYNAVSGRSIRERSVSRMKKYIYEHLMEQKEILTDELNNVNSLLARLERDELKGLSFDGES